MMLKALGSKIRIDAFDTDISIDYFSAVNDILFSKPVKDLADWKQHMYMTRLQHSINVSYYSFLICRKLGLDYRAAARGGLLHDLFFYDWRKEKDSYRHITIHPVKALENASRLTKLSEIEIDIIGKHMWPFASLPKYRETYIVTFIDKLAAMGEVFNYALRSVSAWGCIGVPQTL